MITTSNYPPPRRSHGEILLAVTLALVAGAFIVVCTVAVALYVAGRGEPLRMPSPPAVAPAPPLSVPDPGVRPMPGPMPQVAPR